MALNEFQRVSYKMLGGIVSGFSGVPKLRDDLRKAHLGIRAEAFLASSLVLAVVTALASLALSILAWVVVLPLAGVALPPVAIVGVLGLPFVIGLLAYASTLATPASRAKARAKDIDMKIPYALNYIAAMASAGVQIDEMFRSLATQRIYGECARESERLYRDIAYFGRDSVSAMKLAIARSPSEKWTEFLQGAITTVTSGGNLQTYFQAKAQRYMWENRQDQKAFVDMMGLMAETYVTACVAGPLFLIVMMAIMGMMGGGGPGQLLLIVYVLLPIANLGFVFALQAMTPEV